MWERGRIYRTGCDECGEILRDGATCECDPAFIGPREDAARKLVRARIQRRIWKSQADKVTGKIHIRH